MTGLYLLGQCTWGLLQTLAGLGVFLTRRRCPHFRYHGALVTRWERPEGLSLGLFVFVGERTSPEQAGRLLVHEYGHTVQSLILGPLYLPVIGLPSLVWCCAPPLIRYRRERRVPYSAFYPERWADRLGEKVTGKPAL